MLSPRGIVFSISESSKVMCMFNELQQRWLWLTLCWFCKWFWASMTRIYCCLRRPHASVRKAPSIFDWPLVKTLYLLEGLEEQFFGTEITLQPLLRCNEYSSVVHDHSWSLFLHIKYARDLWPRRNWGDDASTGKEATWRQSWRQSWRQAVVALVAFSVCI